MRNYLLSSGLAILTFLLIGCQPDSIKPGDITNSPAEKPPLAEFKQIKLETIVILGSSTASGIGASEYKYSWAGLLRDRLIAGQVINLAKPGYTTYQILPWGTPHPDGCHTDTLRNITAALKRNPTILIISMTTNDAANGYSVDEIMANLALVRSKALASGVKRVIITTPHPRWVSPAVTAKYMQQRDRILKAYGSSAVNFFDPVADGNNLFRADLLSKDGTHPNDKGHTILYEQIKKLLRL